MTLILELPPEAESELRQEAARRGVSESQFASDLIVAELLKRKKDSPPIAGSLAALFGAWGREDVLRRGQMTSEEIAAEDAEWSTIQQNIEKNRVDLPVPDIGGDD